MPLVPGQVLRNRYRIARLLAQGGFGAVYRAWDLNLNTAVAIKENLTISEQSLKQFTIEARLLASLRQENLPYVIDYFCLGSEAQTTAPGQYLVMEFVEGNDLQSMLDEGGPLDAPKAIPWFSQVCNALIYLHSQNPPVIHRDIKPANIKITPKGQVMLVDFGIAKVYDPSSRTTVGARAVTQGFSPPEQYGTGRTDARSDIYALGATLYAALTAQTPLDSLQRRMGHALTPPRQINPVITPALEQVILRAMQLDPANRFPSVRDFKQALNASLLGQAVVHRSDVEPFPKTQVAARDAYPLPTPQVAPTPPQSMPAAHEQYYPPSMESPADSRRPVSSRAQARPISGIMLLGIIACLLVGIISVIGAGMIYFNAPAPTRSQPTADLQWATETMQALITLQTRAATHTPVSTPTALPSLTPTAFPSPTSAPSWTPVPSHTATLTPQPHPTWYPCAATYPSSRLRVGDRARVSSDPPLANRVRKQPDTSSEILGYLQVGERMEILEGPACSGGWIWWRVRSLEKSLTGWTAEGDEKAYWLVPEP